MLVCVDNIQQNAVLIYFSCLILAGWIGNDAISPIIGEHDPYIRISGRVCTFIN